MSQTALSSGAIVFAEPLRAESAEGIHIPPNAYTLAGFRAWARSAQFPERGRFAFVAGQLYIDLTMEEIETHNKVKTEIVRVVGNLNAEEDRGELYSDGVLVTNTDAHVSNEPDAGFVLWETFETVSPMRSPGKGTKASLSKSKGPPTGCSRLSVPAP